MSTQTFVESKLHRYGLGVMFSANVLGAGSVYILADTGAQFGFALLWVFALTFIADLLMHDMSSRMAVRGVPVMGYIRHVIGQRNATAFAVVMSLVMNLWAVANYAVAGAALAWFIPFINVMHGILIVTVGAITLLWMSGYDEVEALITTMLIMIFAAYTALLAGMSIPTGEVIAGLVPEFNLTYATAYIAMIGTTVYYPNFIIQSSMRPTKQWDLVGKYRRDNAAGIAMTVMLSIGMMSIAAIMLDGISMTLTAPGVPAGIALGWWALDVFMVAVFMAAFTSGTGTMFAAGFAIPQSQGIETEFGDFKFTTVVNVLLSLAALVAILLLSYTDLTPVKMAILMPAINGIIFLPIITFAMYAYTKDLMPRWQCVATMAVIAILTIGSLLTAQDLYGTITTWL